MHNKPQLSAEIKEEEIYMPEQLPENNKPDDKPVKSALHGKIREQFYKHFYVCVPSPNHYPESCICEFTDEEIEPVIEWFTDFLATALEEQRKQVLSEVERWVNQLPDWQWRVMREALLAKLNQLKEGK